MELENNPLNYDQDSKVPDLRSDKQIKSDWMEHMVEYKNPNLKRPRPRLNFAPLTPEQKEHLLKADMYGNERKEPKIDNMKVKLDDIGFAPKLKYPYMYIHGIIPSKDEDIDEAQEVTEGEYLGCVINTQLRADEKLSLAGVLKTPLYAEYVVAKMHTNDPAVANRFMRFVRSAFV
jgi:hypothetical protein